MKPTRGNSRCHKRLKTLHNSLELLHVYQQELELSKEVLYVSERQRVTKLKKIKVEGNMNLNAKNKYFAT